MNMFLVTIALCIFAYTSACCIPEQWEGMIGLTMGSYNMTNKKSQLVEGRIFMSYDSKNKMISQSQTLMVDDVPPSQQNLVLDFNTKLMFVINNGSCTKVRLNDFPERCIPDSDGSPDTFIYGFGANAVEARGYKTTVNGTTTYYAVTADTCTPIATDTIVRLAPFYQFQATTISKVTVGIRDRSVFNVPTACTTVSTIYPAGPGVGFGKRSSFM